MKKIYFTIFGNHKSYAGNAVPKLKMTGKQHWTDKAQEYVQWKEHVITALLDAAKDPEAVPSIFRQNVVRYNKPINLQDSEHALMVLRIFWSNKAHGDPENIFGSIADALFKNDKHLDAITVSSMTDVKLNGKPRAYVSVKIYIFTGEAEKLEFINKNINIK